MGKGANSRPGPVGASSEAVIERSYLAPLSPTRRILYLLAFLVTCSLVSAGGLQLLSLALAGM